MYPRQQGVAGYIQYRRGQGRPLLAGVGHLGRPLSYNNSDWIALYRNLKKAQAKWGMIARILVREGASLRARGHFYKAVVQSVLLYGCETWTITATMMKVLDRFHHRVARRISGMVARLVDGEW